MLRVAIPGGVWRSDALRTDGPVRELALRPIGGEDEVFLLDTANHPEPSARATALLARCIDEVDADRTARSLTVGDREALLLQLRRLTLGDAFDCVLRCPVESCRERMELSLRVSDLLLPPYANVQREYETVFDASDGTYATTYRLPTAEDLERAATHARNDAELGALSLLTACLVTATRDGAVVHASDLSASARDEISAAMAAHDPQAEIELDLTCPTCSSEFSIVFDTAMFLLQELDQSAHQLTHDVHTLALHYHWSEREILHLPPRRRARYLELVAESVARSRVR